MDEVDGRRGQELSDNGEGASFGHGDDLTPLREEYTNAKERLDRQKETFHAFAEEGSRMLRITLVFLGLLVTAVSALGTGVTGQTFTSSQCAFGASPNCVRVYDLTIMGGVGLVVSALGHLIGTEARAIHSPGSVEDIDGVINGEVATEHHFLHTRLSSYRDRIDYNHRVISVLESTLAVGKIGLGFSILMLTATGLAISLGPLPGWFVVLVPGMIGLVLVLAGRSLPDEYIIRDTWLPLSPIMKRLLLTGDGTLDDKEETEPGDNRDPGW